MDNSTRIEASYLDVNASANIDDLPDVDEIIAKAKFYSKFVLQYLDLVAEKTGIPVETIMKYLLILMFVLTLVGTLKDITSNIIGIAYPLFKSIECLESEE